MSANYKVQCPDQVQVKFITKPILYRQIFFFLRVEVFLPIQQININKKLNINLEKLVII